MPRRPVVLIVATLVLAACGGSGDQSCGDPRDDLTAAKRDRLTDDSAEKRQAVEEAARDARAAGCDVDDLIDRSVGAEPADDDNDTEARGECVEFDRGVAGELISNPDTGERKIEGSIRDTAAVRADDGAWLVAISVGGEVVTLRHADNDDPDDYAGSWGSVDGGSEDATNFPVEALTDDEEAAAAQARACVE